MGILTVALWHMDEADGLQYIAGFGGRNDVAARLCLLHTYRELAAAVCLL